jgi:hypothetical protein
LSWIGGFRHRCGCGRYRRRRGRRRRWNGRRGGGYRRRRGRGCCRFGRGRGSGHPSVCSYVPVDGGLNHKQTTVQIGHIKQSIRERFSVRSQYLNGLCTRPCVSLSLFEQDSASPVINPYPDLLVLHVNVIEDHVDGSCPRGELGHWRPIRSIAHVNISDIGVDGIDQQNAQQYG